MENDLPRDVRESSESMVGKKRSYPYSGPKKRNVILTAGFMSLELGVMGFLLPWIRAMVPLQGEHGYQGAQ